MEDEYKIAAQDIGSRGEVTNLGTAALFLVLIGAFLLLFYYSSTNFLTTFSVDDDKLYYGITALEVLDGRTAGELAEKVSSCVVVSQEGIFAERSELRSGYIWNYAALSVLWGSLWLLLGATAEHGAGLSGSSFMVSFYVAQIFALAAAVAIVGSFKTGRQERIFGFVISVISCALLSIYVGQNNWLTRSDTWLTIQHVLSAPDHFNLFNFAPRGISTLVLLAIATLRWSGHIRSFYVGLLALCFLHQSNATMAFYVFVAVDLLVRRQIFRDRTLAALAACTAATILLREELFVTAGWPAVLAAGLALGVMAALTPLAQILLRAIFRRGGDWPGEVATPGLDALLLAVGWTCSLPLIAAVINGGMVDEASGRYLFWQLHSRLGSLLLPAVVAGAAMSLYPYASKMTALAKWLPTLAMGLVAFSSNAVPLDTIGAAMSKLEALSNDQMYEAHEAAETLWASSPVLLDYDTERPHYYSLIAPRLGVQIANFPNEACQ